MDCKIRFGIFCVISLLFVCRVTYSASSTAASTAAPAGGATSASAGGATSAPAGGATSAPAVGPTSAPGGPTPAPGGGPTPAPTPAPIKCNDGACNSSCSTFTTTKTCSSDTTNGCKVEKTTPSGVDTYTFSCSKTACDSSASTVDCCFKDKCNPLAESKGTTMFGNLVSITFIMLAYYV